MKPSLKRLGLNAQDWSPSRRQRKIKELKRRKDKLIKRRRKGPSEEAEISDLKAKIEIIGASAEDSNNFTESSTEEARES